MHFKIVEVCRNEYQCRYIDTEENDSGLPAGFRCLRLLENGVITLYNDFIRKVNGDLDLLLEESDIDAILGGGDADVPTKAASIVHSKARAFVDGLAGKLRERMIDLRVGKTVSAAKPAQPTRTGSSPSQTYRPAPGRSSSRTKTAR